MTEMLIQIQGNVPGVGVFHVAPTGAVRRDDGATVTEANITLVIRALTGNGHKALAGRVQGWWWTSVGA